ncbi:MAG: hypothetical protein HDQ97_08115 [Lachnospiraceae bacterium]|nr:hypothetical protein [Lachnospiraceae bacterium]
MERESENQDLKDINIVSGKTRWTTLGQEVILFLLTITLSALAACYYQKPKTEVAGIAILAGIGFGSTWFAMEKSREDGIYLYDNEKHAGRFIIIYLFSLGGSILFPMLPASGWPYLSVFVGLMLFSNQMVGVLSGSTLLMISVLIQGGSSTSFFVYFISGFVGIVVFSYVNENFKIWLPLFISLLIQFICLSIQEVLYANEILSLKMFAIPAVNLLVCVILLLILLKFFSFAIIFRERDIYVDINDPECPLLVELKNCSKEEYYHAIHTAYLCDRIAKKINYDDALVKACGYYHRIGMIKGENTWENVEEILQENKFPAEVQRILKEYLDHEEQILSKETVLLLFCDTVISSIRYLFSKEPKIELDYQKIINAIFKKKLESGMIDYSGASFGELQEMKKILVEEKLYYDFLR